tara:strand:- start:42870 stop:45191 length:2322 start_codon:yes stop_codon:yes gene_type:complete
MMTEFSEMTETERPDHANRTPDSVRVLRVLGNGRAARAQLVEATFRDGRTAMCVEKVFAPGLLTRLIYRIGFQSPFAYQTNRDAIAASFYRRRVAAAALELTDLDADVAMPIYVRYDVDASAWVLAAQWIDGRGIRPEPPDDRRIRRAIGRKVAAKKSSRQSRDEGDLVNNDSKARQSEISQLVRLMRGLEDTFDDCGLVGSGWQVSPTALVSTANLLRNKVGCGSGGKATKSYTVVDLESGIPAVLVPRYVMAGVRRGILPMFEDVDASRLRRWLVESLPLLTFRVGPDAARQLQSDVDRLIWHTRRWKDSELAVTRRPWRLLTTRGVHSYQQETFRRWRQRDIVDAQTRKRLDQRPFFAAILWWLGCIPTSLGRRLQRLVGNHIVRHRAKRWLRDGQERHRRWQEYSQRCQVRWQASQRIVHREPLSVTAVIGHRILQSTTPASWHRWMADANYRRLRRRQTLLALFSPRYQSWMGKQHIEASIEKWRCRERFSADEANRLRQGVSGEHVSIYARGFGMHLGLKAIAPLLAPAKVGGVAAYASGASVWVLLVPFALTPLLRTLVTAASMWNARGKQIRHFEALVAGLMPTIGSLAFPIQMFSSRRDLSVFLIRDAASRAGRHLPIYGGPDSRTEMALIRSSDFLVEAMSIIADLLGRMQRVGGGSAWKQRTAGGSSDRSVEAAGGGEMPQPTAILAGPRTGLGRRIDKMAIRQIAETNRRRAGKQAVDADDLARHAVANPSDTPVSGAADSGASPAVNASGTARRMGRRAA